MQSLKSITILEPCHQSWQQMTPVTNGRRCESCCKTVTDFTKMSNSEIISHLSYTTNICGRFEEYQLNSINNQLNFEDKHISRRLKGWAMVIALLGSVPAFKSSAQTKVPCVQLSVDTQKREVRSFPLGKIAISSGSQTRRITGHVIADVDHLPVQGATIIAEQGYTTVTDVNGNFSINVPSSARQFKVNYIGFESHTVFIDPNSNNYSVTIKEYTSVLGGAVIIIRPPFFKRLYYRFIKRPIREIFHS